jgi:hypothetical protein
MLPQIFAGELVGAHCFLTAWPGAKTIAVEQFKTLDFPASPVFGFGPKPNGYAGHAKI